MTLVFERTGKTREVAEFRADGWPICPSCGDDELAAIGMAKLIERGSYRQPRPEDVDFCYRCGPAKVVP